MLSNGCETMAQASVYERVAGWMTEIFGEFAEPIDDHPAFAVSMGSALVFVSVYPWAENDAIITTRAYVVRDITPNLDLMQFLLDQNAINYFGRFGMVDGDTITLDHNLIGSTCDKEELRTTVKFLVRMADDYDDRITARWGGKRASDE